MLKTREIERGREGEREGGGGGGGGGKGEIRHVVTSDAACG